MSRQEQLDETAARLYECGMLSLRSLLDYAGWPSPRAGRILLRVTRRPA